MITVRILPPRQVNPDAAASGFFFVSFRRVHSSGKRQKKNPVKRQFRQDFLDFPKLRITPVILPYPLKRKRQKKTGETAKSLSRHSHTEYLRVFATFASKPRL